LHTAGSWPIKLYGVFHNTPNRVKTKPKPKLKPKPKPKRVKSAIKKAMLASLLHSLSDIILLMVALSPNVAICRFFAMV